jgi:hypothetical protein
MLDGTWITAQQFLGALVVLDGGSLGKECREPLLRCTPGAGEQSVQGFLVAGAQTDGLAPAFPRH